MTPDTRVVTVQDPDAALPPMSLELPSQWSAIPAPGPTLAAFSDGRSLHPGIASNVVLTAVPLAEGADLESWQGAVRQEQLSTLPDLQLLEDRRLDAERGAAQWYAASVMTDPNGATVLVRRWSLVTSGLGLTLTLTTLPIADARHAETFDAIAGSWRLDAASQDGDLR